MMFFWTLYSTNSPGNNCIHKNIKQQNIDKMKCFSSSKLAYYYDFWRSRDTENWSNDAENAALITAINYI